MTIYNFHVFHGNGNCIFSLNQESEQENDNDNTTKLLYGFLYSLKSFSNRMSPVLLKDNTFFTYSTSTYQLIFLEMPTSLKMVLIVDPSPTKSNEYYKQKLREFYRTIYVEFVVRNPIIKTTGQSVDFLLFRDKVSDFMNKV
jgi:hypothetical protein